jgi:hypothetical protein
MWGHLVVPETVEGLGMMRTFAGIAEAAPLLRPLGDRLPEGPLRNHPWTLAEVSLREGWQEWGAW